MTTHNVQPQNGRPLLAGFLGLVGELDAYGLNAAAREDPGFQGHRASELARDLLRLLGGLGVAAFGQENPLPYEELVRMVRSMYPLSS